MALGCLLLPGPRVNIPYAHSSPQSFRGAQVVLGTLLGLVKDSLLGVDWPDLTTRTLLMTHATEGSAAKFALPRLGAWALTADASPVPLS